MLDFIKSILNFEIFEISIADILIVTVCTLCAYIIDKVTQWLVPKIEASLAKRKEKSIWRDALLSSIKKPLHIIALTLCCALGLALIDTPSWGVTIFKWIFIIVRGICIWCVIWYLLLVTTKLTEHFNERASKTESKLDDMLVPIISSSIKFILVAFGVLLVIQNLGYSVSSVLAGLGIGGAAVALASKDTLANIFGSLVVFFDHPFDIGDWIEVNGISGSVEEIRLRSTIIRTWDNSLVTMPNQLLTTASINNFERRHKRKMECNFGVLYSTTADQIEKIVSDIKQYILENPDLYAPNHYVGFLGFGDSSLDIEVVVFTLETSKAEHMAVRQKFLLQVMRIVEAAGTGFAFPTRTLEWASNSPKVPIQLSHPRELNDE